MEAWEKALPGHPFAKSARICYKHFLAKQIYRRIDGLITLEKDAVPCLALPTADQIEEWKMEKINAKMKLEELNETSESEGEPLETWLERQKNGAEPLSSLLEKKESNDQIRSCENLENKVSSWLEVDEDVTIDTDPKDTQKMAKIKVPKEARAIADRIEPKPKRCVVRGCLSMKRGSIITPKEALFFTIPVRKDG